MYNKGLFHKWVPKPIMLILIIVLLLPLLTVSGIYTGNIADMVGSLGTLPEMMSYALNATTIGMATVLPLLLRTKRYFRSKELLVGSFLGLAILSLISGTTDEPVVIIISSFFMGAFKMFGMIELVIPIMFMISPKNERGKFNSIFYPISIGLAQIATIFTTQLSYNMEWHQVYIFTSVLLLFCALLCIVFMHNLRPGKQLSLKGFDWFSIMLFSAAMMAMNYVFVFARQQAWTASESILSVGVAAVLLLIGFLYRQTRVQMPNLPLSLFKRKNVVHGLLLTLLSGMYVATSSIQSVFTTGILGYDANTNTLLNVAMVPGVVVGGVLGFYWFRNKRSIKSYVLLGFLAFIGYLASMYFLIAPVIDIEYLIFPSMLKGFGMVVLFIGLAIYTMDKLTMPQMLAAASLLIAVRSFIGTALFGAIFSWAMYQLQWQHVGDLSVAIDMMNPFATSRGTGMALYGSVQAQAILAAAKSLFGYVIIASAGVLAYVLLHRFGNINYRRMVLRSNWLSGKKLKQKEEQQSKEEIEGVVAGIV